MAMSQPAYIVGMNDRVRDELIGLLEHYGYQISQRPHCPGYPAADSTRCHDRDRDLVMVDAAKALPMETGDLIRSHGKRSGSTVVLVSEGASKDLPHDALPDGVWALVRKGTNADSVRDLVGFLTGTDFTIH